MVILLGSPHPYQLYHSYIHPNLISFLFNISLQSLGWSIWFTWIPNSSHHALHIIKTDHVFKGEKKRQTLEPSTSSRWGNVMTEVLYITDVQSCSIGRYGGRQTRSEVIPWTSGPKGCTTILQDTASIYSTCLSFLIEFIMQGGDNSCRRRNKFSFYNSHWTTFLTQWRQKLLRAGGWF